MTAPQPTPLADDPNAIAASPHLLTYGRPGLRQYAGYTYEEWQHTLQGRRGIAFYREMRDTDAIIGAGFAAVEGLIRPVRWTVDPADDSPAAQAVADFVDECLYDMDVTWEDFVAEHLSFLWAGFAYYEFEYKERLGDVDLLPLQLAGKDSPTTILSLPASSKYDDGKIGWKRFGPRPAESLFKWAFAGDGDVLGMWQQSPVDSRVRFIPYAKAMNFRGSVAKGNPEGRSALRNAVWSYTAKKRIEVAEGMGVERDLAGIPVAKVPPKLLQAGPSPSDAYVLSKIQDVVTGLYTDSQRGVVWPLDYDADGRERYKLELLQSGGARQFATDPIVSRYNQQLLMTMLADFLLVGHEGEGARALLDSRIELFSIVLQTWLDGSAAQINGRGVPQLLTLNRIPRELQPTVRPGKVEHISLADLGKYVLDLATAKVLTPNRQLEERLLEKANLPTEGLPPEVDPTLLAPPAPPATEPAPPNAPIPFATRQAAPATPEGTEQTDGNAATWPIWLQREYAELRERVPAGYEPRIYLEAVDSLTRQLARDVRVGLGVRA